MREAQADIHCAYARPAGRVAKLRCCRVVLPTMSVERLFCAVCPGQLKIRLKLFYFTAGLFETASCLVSSHTI